MKTPVIMTVVAAGIGVLAASTFKPGSGEAPSAAKERYMAAASPWTRAHADAMTDPGEPAEGGEVVLPLSEDGHFYADVAIDGAGSSHMLVDTGATVIALTGEDAAAMGVEWNGDDVRPIGRGASGAVYGVPVKLDQVQVGDIEVLGVEAIVVPRGLGVSLLGQSFLGRLDKVEMGRDQMTLGR